MSDTSHSAKARSGARIVQIDEDAAGQRVDNFLTRMLKDVPKTRIYRMIRKGEVRVNGGRVKPTVKLRFGDQVRIPPVQARPPSADTFIGSRQLEILESAILHEDDRLLVLNKPAGIAVHGGSGVSFGVIEGLRRLRPGMSLELVHRLDRETSGCLLVAKRRSTLRALHEHMRSGSLEKHYRLIVRGRWSEDLHRVDAPLHKYVAASGERRVRVSAEGKPSLTTFEVMAYAHAATLLRAQLHTGRTHQIRVHARHAGHSLLGDEKYADDAERAWDRAEGIGRLCLHAERIALPDGAGVFVAPEPSDFRRIWQRLAGPASAVGAAEDGHSGSLEHSAQRDEG